MRIMLIENTTSYYLVSYLVNSSCLLGLFDIPTSSVVALFSLYYTYCRAVLVHFGWYVTNLRMARGDIDTSE